MAAAMNSVLHIAVGDGAAGANFPDLDAVLVVAGVGAALLDEILAARLHVAGIVLASRGQ